MNGSPAKMGTISGTAGHSSALKMRAEENTASALKQLLTEGQKANQAAGRDMNDDGQSKPKKAYGGSKTWGQGQKDSGGTLNDITKGQRAYEKEMKAKNPKWNKREDNAWKTTQNKINKHLGSSKVYDTIKESKTVEQTDSRGTQQVKKGLGRKNEKTLTEQEAQDQEITRDAARDIIKKGKDDDNKTTVLEGKSKLRSSQAGDQDQYTGTVASRTVGKINKAIVKGKQKRNEKRKTKLEEKYKRRTAKGKSTERLEKRYAKKGGDVSTLGTEDDKK